MQNMVASQTTNGYEGMLVAQNLWHAEHMPDKLHHEPRGMMLSLQLSFKRFDFMQQCVLLLAQRLTLLMQVYQFVSFLLFQFYQSLSNVG